MSEYPVTRGEMLDGRPCVVVDLRSMKVRVPIEVAARLASDIWAVIAQIDDETHAMQPGGAETKGGTER